MNRFKTTLAERGLSVWKVAKATGVPAATLYDFANDAHVPSAKTLQRVADYLDVSVDYLLTGNAQEKYYEDPVTAELAQRMKDDHDLRLLFSAAKDASPETLQAVYDVLLALKKREKGE